MTAKTFLLGVGAQKAGTTWLHRYLASLPEADFGFTKEYHVFDAVHLEACRDFQRFLKRDIRDAVLDRKAEPDFASNAALWKRAAFYADQSLYFDYFAGLFTADPALRLTGDISPPYSGLPVEVFHDIKANLARRGMRVKVIFLMRDPLERCWSMIRMDIRNQKRLKRGFKSKKDDETLLRERFSDEGSQIRGRYDLTIRNLREAFDEEDLLFLLYEDMMNEDTIRLVTDFLGIAYEAPDFGRRTNVSPKQEVISEGLQREIVAQFRPAYEAAIDMFGRDKIASLWPSLRLLT